MDMSYTLVLYSSTIGREREKPTPPPTSLVLPCTARNSIPPALWPNGCTIVSSFGLKAPYPSVITRR